MELKWSGEKQKYTKWSMECSHHDLFIEFNKTFEIHTPCSDFLAFYHFIKIYQNRFKKIEMTNNFKK